MILRFDETNDMYKMSTVSISNKKKGCKRNTSEVRSNVESMDKKTLILTDEDSSEIF